MLCPADIFLSNPDEMVNPNRIQVLNLYKKLLRYSEELLLTDKSYFVQRIRKEFNESKAASAEVASFHFKVFIVV